VILDRDGVAIHCELQGTATDRVPLLLTHGYSASSAMWRPNLPALAATRRVITWDIRGHGRSASPSDPALYSQELSVEDMAAVLDAHGVARAAIGGLSLGGFLSLAFHLRHPERVAALLLVDTGPGFRSDRARTEWNEQAQQAATDLDTQGLDALPDRPETRDARHVNGAQGIARAARGILTQQDAAVIESLPSIAVPTLIVVGADDTPFLAAADAMADRIPGATKVVIEDAGHAANMDQPEQFNRAVLDFLEALDPGRQGGRARAPQTGGPRKGGVHD